MEELLNLPITGICSYGKYPICENIDELEADVAVLGVPCDFGTGYLSGARLGPRRLREASAQYGRGNAGYYDLDSGVQRLAAPFKIADCGDADVLHSDFDYTFGHVEQSVRNILKRGAVPAVLGGDHSISIPVGRALEVLGEEVCVIQFDAHLDWTRCVGSLKTGNGSPMRRMSEMKHIGPMVQIGLRGIGSGQNTDFEDAKNYGSELISAREAERLGVEGVLKRVPKANYYYFTVDIDGYDMSIAPGVSSPLPGGLFYNQVCDIMTGIAGMGTIAAVDLVEVNPVYDPSGITARLGVLTLNHVFGLIEEQKKKDERTRRI